MAEQAGAPATGSQAAPATTATSAGASQGTGSAASATEASEPQWAKDLRAGLDSMKQENKRGWDTIRSTTEKRMNDLRRELTTRREARDDSDDSFQFDDRPDTRQPAHRDEPRVRSPREDVREQRRALSDYRVNYSDGTDYHDEVLAIANDPDRGSRFVQRDENGDVDYYASLEAIHQHVELEALRKFKAEKAEAAEERREQRKSDKRDATISGGGASVNEQPNLDDMTEEQLLAEMKRLGIDNPTDMPRGPAR